MPTKGRGRVDICNKGIPNRSGAFIRFLRGSVIKWRPATTVCPGSNTRAMGLSPRFWRRSLRTAQTERAPDSAKSWGALGNRLPRGCSFGSDNSSLVLKRPLSADPHMPVREQPPDFVRSKFCISATPLILSVRRPDTSGSQGVSALGKTQKRHHFIERRNVELKQRASLIQPGPYGF